MNNIPSDEDFARAKGRMRERDMNMSHVNQALREFFNVICPNGAHDAQVIAEGDFEFRAYIFFKKSEDVEACEENGTSAQIRQFVSDELGRQGRGDGKIITVAFEFDSDENVQRNFEGDYFLRMH